MTMRSYDVAGMFFYHNDSQEIDIEWISDPESTSNQGTNNGTRVMQYTNQGPHGTEDSFEINGRASGDATSAVHEYRIDWTQGVSTFYLDGVTSSKLTVTFLRLLGRGLGMRGREFRSRYMLRWRLANRASCVGTATRTSRLVLRRTMRSLRFSASLCGITPLQMALEEKFHRCRTLRRAARSRLARKVAGLRELRSRVQRRCFRWQWQEA